MFHTDEQMKNQISNDDVYFFKWRYDTCSYLMNSSSEYYDFSY